MSDVKNKRVNIYIDQASAEDALTKLQSKADGFNNKIQKCREEQTKLLDEIKKSEAAGKDVTKLQTKYDGLNTQINATNKSLKDNDVAMGKVKQQIESGVAPSFNQLSRYVSSLHNQLKNLSKDAPEYAAKFNEFEKSSQQLHKLKESMNVVEKAQKSWTSNVGGIAAGVLIGTTVQAGLQAMGGYLSGIVSGNAKLSDSLSDIEKSTGLSADAVGKLNSELGKIDTRTATAQLREIAVGLGQIGEAASKENVAAIDQIVVALGDEFGGGAKEITTTLSVLRNNLADIKTGDYATDVTHIGNALNVLGSEGLATAPVVTDIANRIAGIGQTFKLSSGQILGVAATFQELGIETERGSTAVTKMFQKIGAEPEKFAKVAGMEIGKFKELVNTDMLGAFDAVAVGAKKAGANNIVFSQILKELDADGSGAGEVISKLGSNHDMLGKKVDTASLALKSSSSITEEFNKKNNNLAAQLEKLEKAFNSLITSKGLSEFFAAAVRGLTALVNGLKAVPQWLKENQTAIYFLIGGLVLLNATYIKTGLSIAKTTALKIYDAAITKTVAVANELVIRSIMLYQIVTEVLTGKIKIATAVTEIWSTVLKGSLGPIGWVVIAVGAVIAALTAFSETTTTTMKVVQDLADIQAQAAKSMVAEKTELESLLLVARDETKSKQERQAAIDAINEKMPDYLGNLTLENVNTKAGKEIIYSYIEALGKKALAQAYIGKLQELYNKQIEIENTGLQENVKWYETVWNTVKAGGNITAAAAFDIETGIKNRKNNVNAIKDETKALQEKFAADVKSGKAVIDINTGSSLAKKTTNTTATNPFGDKDADKKAKTEDKKRDDLLKKLQDFKFELEQIGKKTDEKEIDRITKKYDQLIKEAQAYNLDFIEIEKEKNKAIAFLINKEQQELRAKAAKFAKEEQEQYLINVVNDIDEISQLEKDKLNQKYIQQKITKEQLQADERKIDLDNIEFKIINLETIAKDEDVADEVRKKAATQLAQLRKQLNKERLADGVKTTDQIIENEKKAVEKRARAESAKLELNVIKAKNPQEKLKADIDLMHFKRDAELKIADLTEQEITLIKEKYRLAEAELIKKNALAQIDAVLGVMQQTLSVIDQFNKSKELKEKAALDKELKANDERRKSITKLMNNKTLTEIEGRRQIAALDIEDQKKKDELEKKQNERNKRFAIAQALINGALAVTKILAETPKFDFGIATAIQIGLAVATTAAQVSAISAQKFSKGALLSGPSHAQGGMPIINPATGAKVAEIEGDEAILSKHTVANNRPLVMALLNSSMNHNGKSISWQQRTYTPINFSGITQSMQSLKYATGGIFANNQTSTQQAAPVQQVIVQSDDEMKQMLFSLIKRLEQPIKVDAVATVSLNKLDDAYKRRNEIYKEAGVV